MVQQLLIMAMPPPDHQSENSQTTAFPDHTISPRLPHAEATIYRRTRPGSTNIVRYTLLEAKVLIERWRKHYNRIRPHSSLGYRPPAPEAIAFEVLATGFAPPAADRG